MRGKGVYDDDWGLAQVQVFHTHYTQALETVTGGCIASLPSYLVWRPAGYRGKIKGDRWPGITFCVRRGGRTEYMCKQLGVQAHIPVCIHAQSCMNSGCVRVCVCVCARSLSLSLSHGSDYVCMRTVPSVCSTLVCVRRGRTVYMCEQLGVYICTHPCLYIHAHSCIYECWAHDVPGCSLSLSLSLSPSLLSPLSLTHTHMGAIMCTCTQFLLYAAYY